MAVKNILHSSKSNEYYTPKYIMDYAHAFFNSSGGIDLDPASCAYANRVVQAKKIYTVEDDGLSQPWSGNVWLNPPYGGLTSSFVSKSLRELEAATDEGRHLQILMLINAVPDRQWFWKLWRFPLVFLYKRIRFYNEIVQSGSTNQPTHGSAIAYLAPHRFANTDLFAETFDGLGRIVLPSEDQRGVSAAY